MLFTISLSESFEAANAITKNSRDKNKIISREYHYDKESGYQYLEAGIKLVHKGVPGKILTDGNVFKHCPHLPFPLPQGIRL
jgi:hypothetical protein